MGPLWGLGVAKREGGGQGCLDASVPLELPQDVTAAQAAGERNCGDLAHGPVGADMAQSGLIETLSVAEE